MKLRIGGQEVELQYVGNGAYATYLSERFMLHLINDPFSSEWVARLRTRAVFAHSQAADVECWAETAEAALAGLRSFVVLLPEALQ